jgi:hypothetical protein
MVQRERTSYVDFASAAKLNRFQIVARFHENVNPRSVDVRDVNQNVLQQFAVCSDVQNNVMSHQIAPVM